MLKLCRPALAVLLVLALVPRGASATGKNPRSARIRGERVLSSVHFEGGMLVAQLSIRDVDEHQPSIVNGVLSDEAADLQLLLRLSTQAPGVMGLSVSGVPVPYQRILVHFDNLSASGSLDLALIPSVSVADGWFYSSHIALPALDAAGDPLGARWRISVERQPMVELVLDTDMDPAPTLWRATLPQPRLRFEGPLIDRALPYGPTPEADARVAAANLVLADIALGNFASAAAIYRRELTAWVQSLLDPRRYSEVEGLSTELLSDVDENILRALDVLPVSGECAPGRRAECRAWAGAALLRALALGVFAELEAARSVQADYHWDAAYVYSRALVRSLAESEDLCLSAWPAAAAPSTCEMVSSLDAAFADSAGALEADTARIRHAILSAAYQRVIDALAAQSIAQDIDNTAAQLRRVSGRGAFRLWWQRLSTEDRSSVDAVLASRAAVSRDHIANAARIFNVAAALVLDASEMLSPDAVAAREP